MYTRDSKNRNIWHGKIDGIDNTFTVVGTYGTKPNPIVVLIPSGKKLALDWNKGESIREF